MKQQTTNGKSSMSSPNHGRLSAEYWNDLLRLVFAGKKVILVGDVVAGLLPRARQIRTLGAKSTFMLATEGMGTGDAPTADDGEWCVLEAPLSHDIVEANHAGQKLLGDLPKQAKTALDQYDPEREALVVGSFLHEHSNVAGRRSLAYRKPEWLALDNKTVIDDVWDKIGVKREASEVVAIDRQALLGATRRLDKGDGVVWSGDSREGVSGGAIGVRWIRSEADVDLALRYYEKNCDRLRVMPFLEGIPCSIHGMVFPDYVAAFRPVEMVVLRKSGSNEFFYAGAATYWDPSPADRAYMRSIAKQVGSALRQMVNYRGIFTVDGVMTKDGFRPTELNTRSGAGIKSMVPDVDNLPLELIAQALISGADLDYKPQELESLIIEIADKQRGGGTWRAVDTRLPQLEKRPVKLVAHGWEWAESGKADGIVSIGPGALGSFIRLSPERSAIVVGPSFAPLARDFWQFIDENMASNIGPLEAAKSVR